MESTVEELVDNLEKEKNLDEKETDEILYVLELASKNIEPSRLSGFVKSMREKINAPTSEIFTQNGININELKIVADVVAKVVIKEQIEYSFRRENETSEKQENIIEENLNSSTEEQQFKELVEVYKNDLDKIYVDLLGIKSEDIPEEFREELAKGIAKRAQYNKELKDLIKRGIKAEDAITILNKKYNYKEEDRMTWLADQANYDYIEIQKIVENKGISVSDATREYYKENPERWMFYDKTAQQIFKGEKEPPQEVLEGENVPSQGVLKGEKEPSQKEDGMLIFWRNMISDFHQEKSNKLELKVVGLELSIEKYVEKSIDDDDLFEKIQTKEKQYRFLKFNKKIQEVLRPQKNNEIKEKRNELLKEASEKYLTGDMTASEIFEELKDTYKENKIDAYDIIEAIEKEAKKHTELSNADTLRKYENNIREYSITIEAYKKLKDNASKEGRKDLIDAHNKRIEILQREIENIKETNRSIKNTILIKNGKEKIEPSNKREVIDKEQEVSDEKQPKKKKGFIAFVKTMGKKLGITPKEVNEEVSELSDLQKVELQEEKKRQELKNNSQIEVSTISVGTKEPTIEPEDQKIDDEER